MIIILTLENKKHCLVYEIFDILVKTFDAEIASSVISFLNTQSSQGKVDIRPGSLWNEKHLRKTENQTLKTTCPYFLCLSTKNNRTT